jgi:hypothetical protein
MSFIERFICFFLFFAVDFFALLLRSPLSARDLIAAGVPQAGTAGPFRLAIDTEEVVVNLRERMRRLKTRIF